MARKREPQQMVLNTTDIVVDMKDMTEVRADVYCNSCGENLQGAELDRKLTEVGGQGYVQSKRKVGKTGSNGLAVGDPGDLNCEHVIHLNIFSNGTWKEKTIRVLEEANRLEARSIAMPAFGTGVAKQNPSVVGKEMLEAIGEFVSRGGCTTLQRITIALIQKKLWDSFNIERSIPLQPQDPEYLPVYRSVERSFEGQQIESIERLPQPNSESRFRGGRDVSLARKRYAQALDQSSTEESRPGNGKLEFVEERCINIPYLTGSGGGQHIIAMTSVLTGSIREEGGRARSEGAGATGQQHQPSLPAPSSLHSLSSSLEEVEPNEINRPDPDDNAAGQTQYNVFETRSSDEKICVSSRDDNIVSVFIAKLSNSNTCT